ncbi:uncharacterized protein A4U43_C04F27120 [Asparagus officinalis]|uniref:Pentacotripeptide-repeat region of PRORP domain-containing protein n=1 Tax=Asparagus officinalis TaxID=4686 RepID=A0A5P1F5R1_ASPOF|nr:pentatricopeptide repeat-containing protein At3g09040, mitochondrial-like [Asparagus officinalis]ONK73093.1 uncharacterized protein A4U43_C04F27120 [Asparagus officinalis]
MKALEFYTLNQTKPKDPQAFYNSLISLCISNKALREANRLRSHLAHVGHEPDLYLNNQFINLYSRCREPEMARDIFNRMHQRNLVSWNAMISCYCSNNLFIDSLTLFFDILDTGLMPDHVTYLTALRASSGSGDLKHGEQMHALIIKNGLVLSRVEVGNALINMYSRFGRLEEAEAVSKYMASLDEITWNSLIAAYSKNGCGDRALALFVDMMHSNQEPNDFTFGSLLGSEKIASIKELHSQTITRGVVTNVVIGSALLDAYARCQKPRNALSVFNSMPKRNIITWNSIISACLGNGMLDKGFQLFHQMGKSGLLADKYTISILLKAASTQLSTDTGKQLHGLAVKMGQQSDTATGNNIITMYSRNGSISDSRKALENIIEPDLISRNAMAQAYLDNEEPELSLDIFKEMKLSGFNPDQYSFACALAACASLSWQGVGEQIHCNMIKTGLILDDFLGSVLIDMYSKSAAIIEARKVFDGIERKDVITCNSMIAGYAHNGYIEQVLKLLSLMNKENLKPDSFTFASVVSVCANSTAIQQGRQVHALISKSSSEVIADTAVTNALITMYSRCGSIKEAKKVFSETKNKNVVSWTSMISGYVQCGYSKEALELFNKMEGAEVTPNAKTFVALLTACSYGGLTDEADKYFKMMHTKYGIKPGFDHYACVVDILGRAGRLNEAEDIIERMPYEPNALVWKILLSSCRIHGDQRRGKRSMEKILALDPGDSAAYILLSNLYADLGDWDGVAEVRQLMRKNGAKKEPGKSWIELRNKVHEFRAGDYSHPRTDEIYLKARELCRHMKDEVYFFGKDQLDNDFT